MKYYLKSMLFLALIFMFSANLIFADFDEEKIKDELPMLLGSTNQGTEFVMTFHPCWEESGVSNELKIYVASAVATIVKLEIPALNLSAQIMTSPNEVYEFGLSPSTGQMYRKTDKEEPQPQQVYEGRACIITSNAPIVCYGVVRYQYSSDGYLAIPVRSLGKTYIVSSWNDPTLDNGEQYLTSYTSIVAAYDSTTVNFTLGGERSNYTPGANSLTFGDQARQKMNRGDVWLIGVNGDYNDLSGSRVSSDKPVAVISGSFCAYVPITVSSCDFLIEQELPMESWGKKYHVTVIVDRKYASFVRVYASKPNTSIYRDGVEWGKIATVGGVVGQGYISRRAILQGDAVVPVTFSADNPISITQYNTGQTEDGVPTDPFQMVLTPMEQYQKSIIFCTPGVRGGVPFMRNYLNLCYQSTENGFIPDDMELGIGINGNMSWQKLNVRVTNPGAAFNDPDVTDGREWKAVTIRLDDPTATYAIRGDTKFAAYGYGFGNYDSYGWPASVSLLDISKPDIWKPTLKYSVDCHGNVIGKAYEEPRKIDSLRSNFASVEIIDSKSYNYLFDFNPEDFIPGEVRVLDWTLEVEDELSDAKATLLFADRAGNETVEEFEYKATNPTISPRITNWGMVNQNDTATTKELTLTNDSGKAIVVDSIMILSKDVDKTWEENGFSLDMSVYTDGTLPREMQPGEELKFNVIFDPAVVKDDFLAGKTSFVDSIGIKAEWSDEYQDYCYYQYNSVVKAIVDIPAPTLIAPENNATEIAALTTFEWSEVADAVSYTLEISRSTAFIAVNTITQEVTGNNYTLLSELKKGITYYWHVKTRTASHESEWSEVWHFTTKEAMPAPTLIAPANTSTNISITPIFEWESISEAAKYNIEVSTEATFNTTVINEEVTSNTYTAMLLLGTETTYYWRVNAMNDNETSDWSETWSFTTEPASAVNDENVLAGSDIKIIPNPANENITIVADFILTSAKIYDLAGNLVLEANTHNIDISQLPHGAYVIVIETKHKTERATFIKE